jgi:hypothetical protein
LVRFDALQFWVAFAVLDTAADLCKARLETGGVVGFALIVVPGGGERSFRSPGRARTAPVRGEIISYEGKVTPVQSAITRPAALIFPYDGHA